MKQHFVIIILLLVGIFANAQVVPEVIARAFEEGDAKELSQYFHNNLEIKILGKKQVTSKNQAARIIQDFFKDNPPKSFKVNFENVKNDSKYGIGTLHTKNGNFRVNMNFMDGKKEKIIYFLNIEKI